MAYLTLNHISKAFPGVQALDKIDIALQQGEIHALCGENGAGKSTLMNILAGNIQPDEGTISINGKGVIFDSPQAAFLQGIAIVYQQLSLTDNLSVAENIFVNQQPANKWGIINFTELHKKTEQLLRQLQLKDIHPKTIVAKLSPTQKQLVEIAKALSRNPSLFILDEPTASLSDQETAILFKLLKKLRSEGVAVVYISHRLEEIFTLSDRVSILKDGKYQGTFETADLTKNALIRLMVGREIKALKQESHILPEIILEVKKLSGSGFQQISFELYRGEILGLSGLAGAGRTEIARAIFGIDAFDSGEVRLHNKVLQSKHPYQSIAKGMAYLPEERKSLGLFSDMSISENIIAGKLSNAVAGKFYQSSKANRLALELKNKLRIVTPGIQQRVNNLSGGNQQKVVLAKWLLTNPDVLIVDEPTHGIDVGAKFEIYEILQSLAASGKGIMIISGELPELIGICDRILVIKSGKLAGELLQKDATEEKLMALASN